MGAEAITQSVLAQLYSQLEVPERRWTEVRHEAFEVLMDSRRDPDWVAPP